MSRAKQVPDHVLVDRLVEVFRRDGFEAASLATLQEASGLRRSSLYHRYPNGKEAMAVAVVAEVAGRFETDVLAPRSEPTPPGRRVRAIADRLDDFYAGGDLSCLLDTLSIADPPDELAQHVRATMAFWIDVFAGLAREDGHPPDTARRRARRAVASIEGALVVARASGDRSAFVEALDDLPDTLLG